MSVATTSANESRAKDNYHSYLSGNSNRPRENNNYKPRESSSRPGDNSYKPRNNGFRPGENNYGSKEFNSKQSPAPYQRGREFPKNNFRDKDDEDENRKVRSHKAADSKPKNQPEQQLDKLETIKRLEREKKAVQKKLREEETEKQKRPTMKQKRNSKSDWTKDYVYGLIDEDDYIEY